MTIQEGCQLGHFLLKFFNTPLFQRFTGRISGIQRIEEYPILLHPVIQMRACRKSGGAHIADDLLLEHSVSSFQSLGEF